MDGNEVKEVVTTEAPVEEAKPSQQSGVDAACGVFGLYFPRFVVLVDQLSNKSLKRVITALVGTPLEEIKPNLKNAEEKAVYLLGEELLKAKMVIIIDAMYQNEQLKTATKEAEQLKAAAKEATVETKGEENGKVD